MEKPGVDAALALELAARLYGLAGGSVSEMVGYDDKNFWLKPSRVADNPHLEGVAPDGYTLKVTNSQDSLEEDFLEGQNQLLAYLAERGVRCPRPVKNKQGRMHSMERLRENGPGHAVRLLEFVPGDILATVPWQASFPLQVGRELARMRSLMDEVDIPAIKARTTPWSLWHAPDVLSAVEHVKDAAREAVVRKVLAAFQRDTKEHAAFLERDAAVIHGDFNQHNVLVRRRGGADDGDLVVDGVLDLGDTHWAPRLFDVALAGTYMAMTSGQVDDVGLVLQGYSRGQPVPPQWVQLLKVCVCARLCQSLVLGLEAHAKDPQNTYVLASQAQGWPLLLALWGTPAGELERQWLEQIKS